MDTISEVYELFTNNGYTHKQIGKKLGFSESTSKRRLKQYKDLRNATLSNSATKTGFLNELSKPRYLSEEVEEIARFKPLIRTGDCIITCDWHIPLHDPKMVNSVLKTAHKHNIKNLIIAGDFWHMDSISHYPPYQREAGLELEQKKGLEIADALLDWFDNIDMCWGNHDFRFVKKLEFAVSFIYAMKMLFAELGKKLDRMRFTDLDYMYYKNDKRHMRVCHPKNYSSVPLSVARQMAFKYTSHDILTAHSHHLAMGFAKDGKRMIMDGGGLFDPSRTEYIQKTSLHHEWVQGYTMFKDNMPTQFSPIIGNI